MSQLSSQLIETVCLALYQGQPFTTQLVFTDAAGNPQDFTGCTAEMQVRQTVPYPTDVADWLSSAGDIVLGGAAGTLTFAVSAADTSALPTGNCMRTWVADIFVMSASGVPQKVAFVQLNVYPAVTRAD